MSTVDYSNDSPIAVNKDFNNVFFVVTKTSHQSTINSRISLFLGKQHKSSLTMVNNLNVKLLFNKTKCLETQKNSRNNFSQHRNSVKSLVKYIKLSLFFMKKILKKHFRNVSKSAVKFKAARTSTLKTRYYLINTKGSVSAGSRRNNITIKYLTRVKKRLHLRKTPKINYTDIEHIKLLVKHKKFLYKNLSKINSSNYSDSEFINFKSSQNSVLVSRINTRLSYNLYKAQHLSVKRDINHSSTSNSILKNFEENFNHTSMHTLVLFMVNPIFLKVMYNTGVYYRGRRENCTTTILKKLFSLFVNKLLHFSKFEKNLANSNVIPTRDFKYIISKRISSAVANKSLKENFIP